MNKPPRDPQALVRETLALANSLHGLLNELGSDEAAILEREASRWQDESTTVVVAGEVKRGKSSLVNALIGADVLPVDTDIATAVPVALVRSDEDRSIAITRFANGEAVREQIDPSHFVDAATGAPGFENVISMTLASNLVPPGITVIDTPGVGGLAPGHRDLTMSAISGADAVVMALSSIEPPNRAELDFLAEVSDRVDRIMLVATRSDLHPDDRNAAIVQELAEHLKRWAAASPDTGSGPSDEELDPLVAGRAKRLAALADQPITLTSAHLARQAKRRAERGQQDRAAELRARSGIGEVAKQISDWGRRRTQIRHANLMRLIASQITTTRTDLERRMRATEGDLTVADELREVLAKLEAVSGDQAKWRGQMSVAMQRMQTQAGRTITRHLNGLRTRYTELIEDQDSEGFDELINELERSVQAAWIDLVDQLNASFSLEVSDLASSLDIDDLDVVLGDLESPESLVISTGDRNDPNQLDHALPVLGQSFMFGNLVNVGAGILGVATGGLGVAAYGIGAAVAIPINRMRLERQQKRAAAADLSRSLNDALFGHEGVSRELNAALGLRMIEARVELEAAIDGALASKRRSVEAAKASLETTARTEAKERNEMKAEIAGRMKRLGELASKHRQLAGS